MMNNILVEVVTNRILQVSDETFDVHSDAVWYSVDNNEVLAGWDYNPTDNTVTDPEIAYSASPEGKRADMVFNRKKGYGTVADQLDALYRDLRDGTTVWQDNITAVKAEFPKVDDPDPHGVDTVIG
jgi:outer membrane protein assembly factor BamB